MGGALCPTRGRASSEAMGFRGSESPFRLHVNHASFQFRDVRQFFHTQVDSARETLRQFSKYAEAMIVR
jgi:hypothetical protein